MRPGICVALLLVAACSEGAAPPASDQSSTGPVGGGGEALAEAVGEPGLRFTTLEHDFGQVDDTRNLVIEFSFRVVGDADVAVLKMDASCGCTVAALDRESYAPGESDRVRIDWKPKGTGRQTQTVKLVTEVGGVQELQTLSVHAEIQPVFRLDPTRIDFGYAKRGRDHERRLRFVSASPLELLRVKNRSEHVRVEAATGAEVGDAAAHTVLDATLSRSVPTGRFLTTLEVEFGEAEKPAPAYTARVLASGFVYDEVRPDAHFFAVGRVDPGGDVDHTVTLTQDSGEPFVVLRAVVEGAPFPLEVEIRPKEQGGRFEAELRLRGNAGDFEGLVRGVVEVLTDVPAEDPMRLDIMGRVGAPKS